MASSIFVWVRQSEPYIFLFFYPPSPPKVLLPLLERPWRFTATGATHAKKNAWKLEH